MRKIGLAGDLTALAFLLFMLKNPPSLSEGKATIAIGSILFLLAFNVRYYLRPVLPATKRKWWIFSFLERKHLEEEILIIELKKRLEGLKRI